MKYHIKPNGNLVITADRDERLALMMLAEENNGNLAGQEAKALENLIANSELQWIPEGSTGDLTSAPMLGITYAGPEGEGLRARNLPVHRFGEICAGGDGFEHRYQAVIARWAYMDYQVKSFLDDLIVRGHCEWQGGFADPKRKPEAWEREEAAK